MPPAVAAAGIGAGGSILGGLLGNRKSQQQTDLENAQTENAKSQSALAKLMAQQSSSSYNLGSPAYGHALNYYSTLLNGNKAAVSQAIAPQVGQLSDTYRGAQRGLEQSGVQGPGRDYALGELNRQRAGQIGQLSVGVQPNAAASLGQLGLSGMGQGTGAAATSGGLFNGSSGAYQSLLNSLLGQNQLNYQNAFGQGNSLASLLAPLLLQQNANGGSQPGGILPSRQTTPNLGMLVGA